MIKLIALVVVVAVLAILAYAATRPDSFRVERSASIKAPPEKIFPFVDDFHQWEAWSPWEGIDPDLKRTYSGSARGRGAVYEWNGNKNVGHGRMEIFESTPPAKVVIKIDFITPFEAHNTVEFLLEPQGESTTVTQAMYGRNSFLAKLMGLFFNMDKMVGDKYEQGLGTLKRIVEK